MSNIWSGLLWAWKEAVVAGGVRLVAATMIGGAPNRVVGRTRQRGPSRSKSVSSARSATRNVRHFDQLAEALDKPAERWRQSSWADCCRFDVEKSRSGTMDGLRKFIAADNCEAVKVGDLHQMREGADEITTASTRRRRFAGPPLVDEDWHAVCEAIYYHCKDLHQAVKSNTFGESKKAKVLWAMKEAEDRGVDYYDMNHRKNSDESHCRLNLWAIHQKSPRKHLLVKRKPVS